MRSADDDDNDGDDGNVGTCFCLYVWLVFFLGLVSTSPPKSFSIVTVALYPLMMNRVAIVVSAPRQSQFNSLLQFR